MPVMVTSVYTANNVNAGKFAGSKPYSMANAGIYLHSGGAGNGFLGKIVNLFRSISYWWKSIHSLQTASCRYS